jgi:hypothetical protein
MKTLIATTAMALLLAACTQPTANSGGMMSADMMKNCPMMSKNNSMMQDKGMSSDMMDKCHDMMKNCQDMMAKGDMQSGMSKDMMQQCQRMMGMMQDQKSSTVKSKPVSAEDHKQHHPAQ